MRTPEPALGQHLTLAVRHREEFVRKECKFRLPSQDGSYYKVQDGHVRIYKVRPMFNNLNDRY